MIPRITQINANKSERHIGKVDFCFYALRLRNVFVFQARIVPKIHEKTKFKSGRMQIVQELARCSSVNAETALSSTIISRSRRNRARKSALRSDHIAQGDNGLAITGIRRIRTRYQGTPDRRLQEIHSPFRYTFRRGANDRVALALVNDFSHLIRVNSRDSRLLQNFRVHSHALKDPITSNRHRRDLHDFCHLVMVESAKIF